MEFLHLERLMAENQFDTIYHEHFSYLLGIAIARMADMHDLGFIDVEDLPTHGGSLPVYLAHAGSKHATTPRVTALLERKEGHGFRSLAGYSAFADKGWRGHRASVLLQSTIRDMDKRGLLHPSQLDIRLHPRWRRTGSRTVRSPDRRGTSWPTKMRFGRAMDTMRDRQVLEEMVERGETAWRVRPDPLVSVKS